MGTGSCQVRRAPPQVAARTTRAAARIFRGLYGLPRLGNPSDPLDDLVYITISTMTTEPSYQRVFAALKAKFRTWSMADRASRKTLKQLLRPAGLGSMKSRILKEVFARLRRTFGTVTLTPLRSWDTPTAESFLTSLPGIGMKVARCVLLYSLGRAVFPVDTHCLRIARRLGWTDATQITKNVADRLQESIPPRLRFGLHVGMVLHGRSVCTALNPKCNACEVRWLCRGEGVGFQQASRRMSDNAR